MTWTLESVQHEKEQNRAEKSLQKAEKIAKTFEKCAICGQEFSPQSEKKICANCDKIKNRVVY